MSDEIAVIGAIATRWFWWGGAGGPFGIPLGPEEDVPGQHGRRQRFERGEIAWSPDQDMVVSVFRLRNEACFEWSPPKLFEYDYYRYNINHNGVGQGQANWQIRGATFVWTRLQGFGEYSFVVKGCTDPFVGSDECKQGYTVPVRIVLGTVAETPDPGGTAVTGLFEERWHELGAWSGPLGKATSPAVVSEGVLRQAFERGELIAAPGFGPNMVVAAFQRGRSVELVWGGANESFNAWRVQIYSPHGTSREELVWYGINNVWARPGIGSGSLFIEDAIDFAGPGTYAFLIYPLRSTSLLPSLFDEIPLPHATTLDPPPAGATPAIRVALKADAWDAWLDAPARTGTPGRAWASHRPRMTATARHFASLKPLHVGFQGFRPTPARVEDEKGSSEDDTLALIAHLEAVSDDPDFRVLGELPSRPLIHVALRQMVRGKVGTDKDYDMTLKGLMPIAYRYAGLLGHEAVDYILHNLVPPDLFGGHDRGLELHKLIPAPPIEFPDPRFPLYVVPETENHLLMTESSRYLVNQLMLEKTGDQKYNNLTNGLTGWLLGFMHTIAKHDFLEFNARPYQRHSLHALLNLHEFAKDDSVRTAAQILLDYVMVKFAVSSSRLRRVGPFRRHQWKFNHPDNEWNDLMALRGDQVTGFFVTYGGPTTPEGAPAEWFPRTWQDIAMIAAPAAYRPPPAAYILAMTKHPPAQHRFYHGTRPLLLPWCHDIPTSPLADLKCPDLADGGVEIYYGSPSFMLTAGGMFLNSGYGNDHIDIFVEAWEQTARAQATTLMPTKGDLKFADLIRFNAYPDPQTDPMADDPGDPDTIHGKGVTTGVHRNFACGADLQIPACWVGSQVGSWTFLDLNAPDNGELGFYVAAYRTPPERPEELVEPLGNLGLLHAVENDTMSFVEFRERTLQRNPNLPAKLAYGGRLEFHSADDQTFSFWLQPEGLKYDARVTHIGHHSVLPEPSAPGGAQDFTLLPLVSGEYMNSEGHTGVIKVTHPDCTAPLVLDFGTAENPVRTDNNLACPAPFIERAKALIEVTSQLLDQSLELALAGGLPEAVRIAQTAVRMLDEAQPPASVEAEHLAFHAHALSMLTQRLIWAGQTTEAGREALSTANTARRAARSGADPLRVAWRLVELSHHLTGAGLDRESAIVVQTGVDILRRFTPSPDQQLPYLENLSHHLFHLAVREIKTGDLEEVPATARETADTYRRAVAAGADPINAAWRLVELSHHLTGAGLHQESAHVVQTAVDLMLGFTPTPDQQLGYLENLAHHLFHLAVRRITIGDTAGVPAVAQETATAYRRAVAAGADPIKAAWRLVELSHHLTGAGLHQESAHVVRAAVDVLRGFPPAAPDQQLPYLENLAHHLLHLALREIQTGDLDEVPATALETAATYRRAVAAGADPIKAAWRLVELSHHLTGAHLHGESTLVVQTAVDLLRGFTPTPDQQLAFLENLAHHLFHLTVRLIASDDIDTLAQTAEETITAHKSAAAAGIDPVQAAGRLIALSHHLTGAGFPAQAAEALQTAAALSRR